MTYLPSLIKKIDDFYTLAESLTRLKRMAATPETWSMPDDPEEEDDSLPGDEFSGLYPKVMDVINEINASEQNEDIASELQLIAELYKKSIEINGGFKQVQDYIRRAMANIDMLIDESDGVIGEDVRDLADEVLEDLSSDLRQRAKSTVAPQANEAAAQQQLKAVKDAFNSAEARQEIESQKSVYEKGKPGQETGHTIVRKKAETPNKYAKEIARLEEMKQTEANPNARNNIDYLIGTLKSLIEQMKTVTKLQGETKIAPDDPATVQAFNAATAELDKLRKQRLVFRRKLNESILKDDQTQLRRRMYETNDPREKAWIDERIKLLDLRMDEKLLRKRDMIKALKARINSTGTINEHGDFLPLEMPEATRLALQKAYDAGKGKSITKSDYDRELTEQRITGQGRKPEDVARLPGQRGGYRPVVQKDFSKFTFPALIKEMRDRKNTAIDSARRYIANAKEGGRIELKEDVKAVSDAIRKGDNNLKQTAINNLRNKIRTDFSKQREAFQSYRRSLKLVPYINYFEKSLDNLANMQNDQGIWQITDSESVFNLVDEIKKFTEQYAKYYQGKERPTHTKDIKPRFDAIILFLNGRIRPYILNEILKVEDTAKTADRIVFFSELIRYAEPDFVSKKESDRARTEQKAREQARDVVPRATSTRGGPRTRRNKLPYLAQPDLELASFAGLVYDFQEKINTAFTAVKQLMHLPKTGGDPIFKPVVDELASAIVKNDTQAKYNAIRKLKEMSSQYSKMHISSQKTIQMAKLMSRLRGLRDDFKSIASWQDPTNNDWILDENQKSFVLSTLQKSKVFLQYLEKYKEQNYFGKIVPSLTNVINYLDYIKQETTS